MNRIAVPYENGQVFGHFGHTQQFKLYTVSDGAVTDSRLVPTLGQGHGALAGFLQANGVDTLICGGIGGGARQALSAAGITLYPGVTGAADDAVKALLAGTLAFDPDTLCSHHGEGHSCADHGEGHSCAGHGDDHGCGGHCGG